MSAPKPTAAFAERQDPWWGWPVAIAIIGVPWICYIALAIAFVMWRFG